MDLNRFKKGSDNKKDYWDWWLSDDPPAPAVRQELRQKRVEHASGYRSRTARAPIAQEAPPPAPTNVTININLSKLKLPKVKKPDLPKLKLPALPYKKLAVMIILVGLLIFGGKNAYSWHHQRSLKAKIAAANAAVASKPARSAPSFIPAAPAAKPQLGSTTSKETAYDGTRDTFSYVDNINGTQITVSEQPLPGGSAQQTVDKVAKQISATQPIILNNGTAYLNTNAKTGAQSIVFSAKGLLVFINSAFNHPNDAYAAYINSLQ